MKAAFGLAWDHGRRRALIALTAGILALAMAVASIGGTVTTEEARRSLDKGQTSSSVLDQPIFQPLGLSWG